MKSSVGDSERLPRKLAAILYADVAEYSRLTGEDEDATHRRLSEYLDLISSTVDKHRGRVMHYAGDAVLAKFEAVIDAISGAVAIQNELQTRNQELPDERKVQFRIGVNLGDVIEDREDIYGDGVNKAPLSTGDRARSAIRAGIFSLGGMRQPAGRDGLWNRRHLWRDRGNRATGFGARQRRQLVATDFGLDPVEETAIRRERGAVREGARLEPQRRRLHVLGRAGIRVAGTNGRGS